MSATLLDWLATRLWFAADKTLRANWTIFGHTELGPRPKPTPPNSAKKVLPTGILNTKNLKAAAPAGILNKRKPGTPNQHRTNTQQPLAISNLLQR